MVLHLNGQVYPWESGKNRIRVRYTLGTNPLRNLHGTEAVGLSSPAKNARSDRCQRVRSEQMVDDGEAMGCGYDRALVRDAAPDCGGFQGCDERRGDDGRERGGTLVCKGRGGEITRGRNRRPEARRDLAASAGEG